MTWGGRSEPKGIPAGRRYGPQLLPVEPEKKEEEKEKEKDKKQEDSQKGGKGKGKGWNPPRKDFFKTAPPNAICFLCGSPAHMKHTALRKKFVLVMGSLLSNIC